MIIVFEGADAAGKTTLAGVVKKVAEAAGQKAEYIHGVPFCGWCEEAHRAMLHAALDHAAKGKIVCVDRHWPSEFVYGPIFRGKPDYESGPEVEFDATIRRLGLYVLCVPDDLEAQEKRWQDGRASGKFEHFPEVRQVIARYADLKKGNVAHSGETHFDKYVRFGDFVSRGSCLTYDVDVDGRDMERFAKRVLREATGG